MQAGTTFGRHALRVAALLVPVAYVAQLLATAVHEFLGHGMTAVAVGGRFTGLALAWDGMGWAACEGPDPPTLASAVAILAGGVAVNCLFGLAALAAAPRVRSGPPRWSVLIVSASALLEGASYTFWSAWQVDRRGDIGRLLRLLHGSGLAADADAWRTALLVAGGALTVLGTVLPWRLLVRDVEASFPPEVEITRRRHALVAAAFGLGGAAAWWLFDWEQLLPGIGVLPQVVGGTLFAATGAWIAADTPPARRSGGGDPVSGASIAGWWGAAVGCALLTTLWLGSGVSWDG